MRLPPRDQRDYLKIGELAKELSITPRTIRLYEDLGLISPARTTAGTRLYARKDMKRLDAALRLGRCGVSLEHIQRLAMGRTEYPTGAQASAAMSTQLAALQKEIHVSIKRLQQMDRDIATARGLIGQCADCPNRPNRTDCPHCPVDKHVELSDIARLIWDPECP